MDGSGAFDEYYNWKDSKVYLEIYNMQVWCTSGVGVGQWCWSRVIKCFEESKSKVFDERLMLLLCLGGIGGRFLCNPLLVWIQIWLDLKSFLKWNVFQLSEKQQVVLSNQPVVLFLEGFEKGLTWLTLLLSQINRLFR